MSFTSPEFFIFFFIFATFFFHSKKNKKWILLIASLLFYASFSPILLVFPLIISLITYIGATNIKKAKTPYKKPLFILTMALTLIPLFFFKYYTFFMQQRGLISLNFVLPIGISFYTFQSLSYVFEMYKGNIRGQNNFLKYLIFVTFFPLILSGPIERATNLLPQIRRMPSFDYERVTSGIRLFAWGLFKKVVIADRLAVLVDQVYKNPQYYTGFPLVLATSLFVYELYCDFSGYSDMARGLSRIIGFSVINNFNFPFSANSISDFWRRWHISLSSYLKDYVYIPLALRLRHFGNRGIITALFVTFIAVGFWHGPNLTYGIFGTIQALAISAEIISQKSRKKLFKNVPVKIGKVMPSVYVLAIWNISCIFFRSENMSDAIYVLRHLFLFEPIAQTLHKGLGLGLGEIIFSIFLILLLEVVQYLQRKKNLVVAFLKKPVWVKLSVYYLLILVILLTVKFTQSKFIYFNF